MIYYYDGQGFMIRKDKNKESALELDGMKVCVQTGTTTELNLADYFRANNMKFEAVKFPRSDEALKAYETGQCDVLTADVSQLYALRLRLAKPDEHVILADVISKEPLAPVVRQRDEDWLLIVKWTLYAMLNAEELGVDSKNIDQALKSQKPDVMRLVGTEGAYGEQLGLTKDWAARIIRHVGNYGEVYERNVGVGFEAQHPARAEPALEQRRHPVRAADPIAGQDRIISGRTAGGFDVPSAIPLCPLVSRFRSSYYFAALSFTNFGIEGH